MKTIFAAVVLLLVSAGVSASGNLKVNLNVANSEIATVKISNSQMSTFEIKVSDVSGKVIFSKETLSPTNLYDRKYDFSKLDNGIYFLTVKVANETNKTRFSIINGDFEVLEERKSLEPFFKFDDNKLKISFLNFSSEESTLIVYDDKRNELYSKELSADFNIQHGLDVSKLPTGSYEVVLSTESNLYDYTILID